MNSTVAPMFTLNSAAQFSPGLAEGPTEIFYLNDDHPLARDYRCGDKVDLGKLVHTHRFLGQIQLTDLESIFYALQGENWSPKGEANEFIRSKKLRHTSMSVGDVVKIGVRYFAVASIGFVEL